MKTKFTLLMAAGLLFTVAIQAQNYKAQNKVYAGNYPSQRERVVTTGLHGHEWHITTDLLKKKDRRFHKEAKRYHKRQRRHHCRHHRH